MKVRVLYELPLDSETATRMIDAARAIGFPHLAVEIEVDEDTPGGVDIAGISPEAAAGVRIGEMIGELSLEFSAAGGPHLHKSAEVVA